MKDYTEKTVDKEIKYRGPIFTVEHHDVTLPNGKTAGRDIVTHNGAVAILVVQDGRILLVRQYRKAIEQHFLEIPAGKLDHGPEEDALQAAKRELEEETNLAADDWRLLYEIVPTPGYCTEKIALYQAEGIHEISNAAPLDEDEFVDVCWMPLSEAATMMTNGTIQDAKTIIAIQAALQQSIEH